MTIKIKKAFQQHDLDNFQGTDSGVDGPARYSAYKTFVGENISYDTKENLLNALGVGESDGLTAFPKKSWANADEAKTSIDFNSAAWDWTIPSTVTWSLDDANTVSFTAEFASEADQTTFLNKVFDNDANGAHLGTGVFMKPDSDQYSWS